MINRSCSIPITTLQLSPFLLVTGDTVVAKLTATNEVGESAESAQGGSALIPTDSTVPDPPTSLTRATTTSQTSLTFTWTAPANNGGQPLIDYAVYWDQGTGSFVELETSITATSYTKSTGIGSGSTYQFKVQARNTVGFSGDSATLEIVAASAPDSPAAPTTASSDDTNVVIDWTAPATNGDDITGYIILI